jgi:protein tyrosine phosphatase (PTP) superfamily phosphohydrolase (DUF442 family)
MLLLSGFSGEKKATTSLQSLMGTTHAVILIYCMTGQRNAHLKNIKKKHSALLMKRLLKEFCEACVLASFEEYDWIEGR